MTGHEETSEFFSPRPSNIEVEDRSLRVFSKKKNTKKSFALTPTGSQIYRSLKELDLIKCEWKVHVVASLGSQSVLTQDA